MFDFILKYRLGRKDRSRIEQPNLDQVQNEAKATESSEPVVYPSMMEFLRRIADPVSFEALKNFYNLH